MNKLFIPGERLSPSPKSSARAKVCLSHRCNVNILGTVAVSFGTLFKSRSLFVLENPLQNFNGVTDFRLEEFCK